MTPPTRRIGLLLLLPLLALLNVSCSGESSAAAGDAVPQEPVVSTMHGPLRGSQRDGVFVFKGVRYGADTATTRFAAPAPPAASTELADALEYGNSCPQTRISSAGGLFDSWRPEPQPALSEDCLFLNVWTPGLADGGARPVMVWLHGGGFASGDGSSRVYEGTRLAARGDVVVVTINHRLNLFGYLALAHYGEGFGDSSVAGVLDMILALEWVRDNAEAFGGDPGNVTIFGESGGGAKVSTLLSTERAKGLFHRAVVQSGAMLRFPEREAAQTASDRLVANLGLDASSIAEIRSLPADDLRAAAEGTGAGSAPSIDGNVLTRHPFHPDAAPAGRDVPLMLGTNRTENSMFAGIADPSLFELDWDGLRAALGRAYPEADVEALVAGYRELQPESNASDIYFEATTDARWLSGHVLQAERKAEQGGAPAYLYLFDWDTPVDGGKWRSPHALEIGFVFDNVAHSRSMSGVGDEQQRVADIMADTWIAFARSGDPSNEHLPDWPAYQLETRPVMVLGESPELVPDARGAQRALLDDSEAYGNRYRRD